LLSTPSVSKILLMKKLNPEDNRAILKPMDFNIFISSNVPGFNIKYDQFLTSLIDIATLNYHALIYFSTQFLQLGFNFLYAGIMRYFREFIHCAGINVGDVSEQPEPASQLCIVIQIVDFTDRDVLEVQRFENMGPMVAIQNNMILIHNDRILKMAKVILERKGHLLPRSGNVT
jgi:hypothetical protein